MDLGRPADNVVSLTIGCRSRAEAKRIEDHLNDCLVARALDFGTLRLRFPDLIVEVVDAEPEIERDVIAHVDPSGVIRFDVDQPEGTVFLGYGPEPLLRDALRPFADAEGDGRLIARSVAGHATSIRPAWQRCGLRAVSASA
ncbi:hypothetical protein [Methylobrevis pamukkalensis]|uniref:hypothetical protein n=1 Tax=Methylobrevis pamukkalensis TaxID=1439726 RepID=UPI00114D2205|nr:hypothetical protein [Methylobrevis pamukkalensis]